MSIERAQKALGQLFIVGFDGLELSDDTASFLSQAGVGGVMLRAHNYENPGQVAELVNQVQECRSDLPFWICVDHEGGTVQRFKRHFTKVPEAAIIGATSSPKLAFEVAEMMGKELKAVGINVNFAPVADINTNPKNTVIGNRAFGNDEETVTKIITAIVRGHLVAGVQPCIKHFPGHGDTTKDSHFELPKVDTSLETMMDREFKPFIKAFKSHCSLVMTAHIVCTKIDPERPATLSPKIINDILRKQLRYSRVVISDDLEMKSITDHFGAEDAPRLAVEAGCDLLIYRTEAAARHAYQSLLKSLEAGKLAPDTVLQAEARSRSLKQDKLMPYKPVVIAELAHKIGIPEHQAIIEKIQQI